MGFSEMIECLQEKEKGRIVLCNSGNFYVAIGKDAILLNKLFDMKLTCMKPKLCKVGFPLNALEKYTDLIVQKRYSYIVYNFDQEELKIIESYKGNYESNGIIKSRCYCCNNNIYPYKEDKYIKAVAKLYEEDEEEQKEIKS